MSVKRRKRRETKYGAACVFLCTHMGAREVDEDGRCMACTMQSQGKKAKACHQRRWWRRPGPLLNVESPSRVDGAVKRSHVRLSFHPRGPGSSPGRAEVFFILEFLVDGGVTNGALRGSNHCCC